jgi:hypothetical protein
LPDKSPHTPWRDVLLFLGIFAAAAAIRLVGLDWDGYHPDENPRAGARVLTGQLSVSSFYPPLLDYLTAMAYAALYVIGRALSWWSSSDAFRAAFFEDRDTFYLTARLVTTALSALIAPLTFLLALTHNVSRAGAVLAGAGAALIPGSVFWAHIAKSDVALAPAFLFVVIATSALVRHPSDWRRTMLLGLAIALAVSVKHSAVFFVAPFLLITLFSSRQWRRQPLSVRTFLTIALSALLFWVPLNIGIVIDPRPFLDAQLVQTSMSVRSSGLAASIGATVVAMTSADAGLPLWLLLLWVVAVVALIRWSATPRPQFRNVMLTFAAATAFAAIVLAYLGGARQPTNLWLPYVSLMAVLILVVASASLDLATTKSRFAAIGVLVLCLAAFSWRLVPIVNQAVAPSNGERVAAVIKSALPQGAAVFSAIDLNPWLPLSPAGAIEQRTRNERLANKYNIQLPPPDGPLPPARADAYKVFPFPFVFGGLETLKPDEVKTVVPYAWPLQPEEWRLDYWRERGYHYVVADAGGRSHPVEAYRLFYQELDVRCQRVAEIPTSKPLYWEQDILVYNCAPQAT